MPRIAEIKELDGAVWVRVDLAIDPSGIGIYTPDEIEALERSSRSGPENALRRLSEALGVDEQGGRRIVGIPNLNKFWEAYDEAKVWV